MKDEKIISYLKNELMENELIEVKKWIDASGENKRYFNRIKFIWENSSFDYQNIDVSSGKAWEKINSSITGERTGHKSNIRISISAFRRIAAVFLVLISIGFITLLIVRQDRISEVEWTSAYTTSGINKITLHDGSHIWLNNNSEISYPDKFKGSCREINLKGEAFFEVKSNKKKPFIIHTATSEICVLGTSFNVNSGRTMPEVIVTVVTGRVSLCDISNKESKIILEPGDQGINFPDRTGLVKRENKDLNFIAWKTGKLIFENSPLEDVCKTLSGHYNIPFILDNEEILKEKSLTATFNNKDINEILKILEITMDISYKKGNNKITLTAN